MRGAELHDREASGRRQTLSFDGIWEVGESERPDHPPAVFDRQAPVPGLLYSATPPFRDVGSFSSRELQYNRRMLYVISGGLHKPHIDEAAMESKSGGVAYQDRDYFWYRRRLSTNSIARHTETLSRQGLG